MSQHDQYQGVCRYHFRSVHYPTFGFLNWMQEMQEMQEF